MIQQIRRAGALGCAVLALAGCTVTATPVRPVVVAPPPSYAPPPSPVLVAPPPYRPVPPLRAEMVPPPPSPRYVWQPGHWRWTGADYVWVPGRYLLRQPGWHVWVHGRWVNQGGNWVWVGGRWN